MNIQRFKLSYASRDELIASANVVTVDLGLLMELTGKAFVIEPKATQRADDGTWDVELHLKPVDQYVSVAVPDKTGGR
jgi:hypothetical protein